MGDNSKKDETAKKDNPNKTKASESTTSTLQRVTYSMSSMLNVISSVEGTMMQSMNVQTYEAIAQNVTETEDATRKLKEEVERMNPVSVSQNSQQQMKVSVVQNSQIQITMPELSGIEATISADPNIEINLPELSFSLEPNIELNLPELSFSLEPNIEVNLPEISLPEISFSLDPNVDISLPDITISKTTSSESNEYGPQINETTSNVSNIEIDANMDIFLSQLNEANLSIEKLKNTQLEITMQAANMTILSAAMINGIVIIEQSIQGILAEIIKLNQFSIELNISSISAEIAVLIAKIGQALGLQMQLNLAMSEMEINAAGLSYQQSSSKLIGQSNGNDSSAKSKESTPGTALSLPNVESFTNTGIEQFVSQLAEANISMQRLKITQLEIIVQTGSMTAFSGGMIVEIQQTNLEIQKIVSRVKELNQTSIDLRADETNGELEVLRTGIEQTSESQVQLNRTMREMEVSSVNVSYQELNGIVSTTEQSIRENSSAQEEFGKKVEESSKGAEILKGILSTVKDAIDVKAIMDFANEYQVACNSLQARTGATADEMNGMSESMKNIYANNFGESFEDIASSMETVRQVTGTMGGELESTTQTALMMRDTFGLDVEDSIESVDTMMKQFGLSSQEAYTLIAQGAQQGLNQNGGLLDSINQYSGYFHQAGLDATAMFDMLKNGSESGMLSIDQIGGAMQQFSTKMSDGSAGEALLSIGLDPTEMATAFEEGGERASWALQTVMTALQNTQDPLLQGQAGVQLFGDSWEGVGENAILAMSEMGSSFDETKTTLEELNSLQCNDLQSALESLGKSVGVELLDPIQGITDKFLELIEICSPYITELASAIFPLIGIAIEGIIDAVVRLATAVVDNWSIIGPIILGVVFALGLYAIVMGIAGIVSGITGAITAVQTVAQEGLNAALLACPLTWIILLVIALIAIFYAVIGAINKFAGTSISATGVIAGVFFTVGAFIYNLIIGLINAVIDIFVVLWNFIAKFANFFGNVFNDPVGAIARLFFGLVDTILELLQTAASAIDTICGTNLSGAVQGWRDGLNNWVDDTFGEGEEYVKEINAQDYHVGERKEYGASYDKGYEMGKDFEDSIPSLDDLFGGKGIGGAGLPPPSDPPPTPPTPPIPPTPPSNPPPTDPASSLGANIGMQQQTNIENISENIQKTESNTSDIKDNMDGSSEDLKYIRDIAEQEVINRFTTSRIKVEMINNNNVNSDVDLDGFSNKLKDCIEKEMYAVAEGAH